MAEFSSSRSAAEGEAQQPTTRSVVEDEPRPSTSRSVSEHEPRPTTSRSEPEDEPRPSTSCSNSSEDEPPLKRKLVVAEVCAMWNVVKVYQRLRTREQAVAFAEERSMIQKEKMCHYHKKYEH